MEFARFEDFQAVVNIPGSAADRGRFFKEIREQVFHWIIDRLENGDKAALGKVIGAHAKVTMLHEVIGQLSQETANRVNKALDDLILEQAGTIGARVICSPDVQQRILEWERHPNGPIKYKKLGEALAQRVTPNAKVDLSPKMKPFREEVIKEIKQLWRVLRGRFNRGRPPSDLVLTNTAVEIVADQAEPYDRLRANLVPFRWFLEAKPADFKSSVFGEGPTPTRFVEEFMGYSTRRDPEALRQAIARMSKPSHH